MQENETVTDFDEEKLYRGEVAESRHRELREK